MYGTTLTNAHVRELMASGAIKIYDFKPSNMKLAHYRLRPLHLFRPGKQLDDGSHDRGLPIHDFKRGEPFTFNANEYLIVTTIEHIVLGQGIVGQVIPASTLVEQGFDIISGKLDPGYGDIDGKPQNFIIGIKNMLNEENRFHPDHGIANISFEDFGGLVVFKRSGAQMRNETILTASCPGGVPMRKMTG